VNRHGIATQNTQQAVEISGQVGQGLLSLDVSFIPRKPAPCALQVHCSGRAAEHVLNFDRVSVGVNK